MSEWTPTTEDVRDIFAWATYWASRELGAGVERETLMRGASETFDRWLSAHDRQVTAAAWDEGYSDGRDDQINAGRIDYGLRTATENPYRQEGAE